MQPIRRSGGASAVRCAEFIHSDNPSSQTADPLGPAPRAGIHNPRRTPVGSTGIRSLPRSSLGIHVGLPRPEEREELRDEIGTTGSEIVSLAYVVPEIE